MIFYQSIEKISINYSVLYNFVLSPPSPPEEKTMKAPNISTGLIAFTIYRFKISCRPAKILRVLAFPFGVALSLSSIGSLPSLNFERFTTRGFFTLST